MNRWELTDEVRNKYGNMVQDFLKTLGTGEIEEFKKLDLSDSGFNPYTLCEYLEELGYERGAQDDNGWQMDFWIPFRKDGHTPIEVYGTGMTFELGLSELDYDWKERELKNELDISEVCAEAILAIQEAEQFLDNKEEG